MNKFSWKRKVCGEQMFMFEAYFICEFLYENKFFFNLFSRKPPNMKS